MAERTITLDAIYIHLIVREDGLPAGEATVHLEPDGHLGVSGPWAVPPAELAAAAARLLPPAQRDIAERAADPANWPSTPTPITA